MKPADEPLQPTRLGERRIDYDAFQAAQAIAGAGLKARLGVRRGVRNRERDPAERASLMRLDKERLARWYATGEWTRVGPRRIRIRL
jgi:hypothetical protein